MTPPMPPPPPMSKGKPPATTQPTVGISMEPRKPAKLPYRMFLYAVEKFGKTTLAAQSPSPFILMAGDNGYDTLLSAGSVPQLPAHYTDKWLDAMAVIDHLANNKHDRKTLVIDGVTGLERMCHEYVCERDFSGDWGEKGFGSFQKGYEISVTEWLRMLQRLDVLRAKGMNVILLGHARTKAVKNPMGADYDRYEPECHAKTWAATAKWTDAILFGKFHTIVDVTRREASKKLAEQKGKATGGTQRVIFAEPNDAFVAGQRYGMESNVWLNDRDSMYSTLAAAMKQE